MTKTTDLDLCISKRAKRLFLLCWLAYAASYVTKLCFSICMNSMISRGMFDEAFGGAIGTALYASYGIGQLVNGWLGDKISPKYMVGIGLSIASAMDILMALATNKYILLVIWCVEGVGCSMLWAPILRCVSEYLPPKERDTAGTWISATIPVGTIVSYVVGGIFLDALGYRAVFTVSGLIGALFAFVWIFGMHSLGDYFTSFKSKAENASSKAREVNLISVYDLVRLVFSSGAAMAIVCIFFNGILKDGVTLWLPTYLSETFALSDSTVSWVMNIIPIINLAGAFVAVQINKRIAKNEFLTMALMFAVSFIGIVSLYFFGKFNVILAVIFMSLSTSSMLGANTMLLTFVPMFFTKVGRVSAFTGFLDAVSYLSSAVSAMAIGLIAGTHGWSTTVIVWAAIAFGGIFFSTLIFPVWKKGRAELERAE